MAFETTDGTVVFSYGELMALLEVLGPAPSGALGELWGGEPVAAHEVRASLLAASMTTSSSDAKQLIDIGLARLGFSGRGE